MQARAGFDGSQLQQLADILYEEKRFREAAALYAQVPGEGAGSDFWYKAGCCYYFLQQKEEAQACFQQARETGQAVQAAEFFLDLLEAQQGEK